MREYCSRVGPRDDTQSLLPKHSAAMVGIIMIAAILFGSLGQSAKATDKKAMTVFSTIDVARKALASEFKPHHLDALLGALQPAIGFEPVKSTGAISLGTTRIGGQPDLPPATPWPVREIPKNVSEIASRGGVDRVASMTKLLSEALPYQFMAQIDLGEAAALGKVAAGLPTEGRLLFFYDTIIGPWNNGLSAARVIWDNSPISGLERKPTPKRIVKLGAEYTREANESERKHKLPLTPAGQTPYWAPARPMKLVTQLRLPERNTWNAENNKALARALKVEEVSDVYAELFDQHWGLGTPPPTHQMFGAPLPEQSDPRFDAALSYEFGLMFLPDDEAQKQKIIERLAAAKKSGEWILLLQIDNQDYLQQEFVEGTIYFLMRRSDLKARAFDKVVAVYQQT